MSKALFLKYFQENLCVLVKELITEKWEYDNIIVTTEKNDIDGMFDGFIDICITDEVDNLSVVALEIEHRSYYTQALKNIQKMKTWAHNSSYRTCGFLHIMNTDCCLSPDQISELVKYAKQNEHKGLGFYYDFVFYTVEDSRETWAKPESIVNSMDFYTRLWMLLEHVGMA